MVEKKLRVFVSGKEDELFNERVIANDTIESFELTPEGSENRSASDGSIESEFLEEVRTSHIYVGILGNVYSPPTIKEFETARTYQIPTLIFIRNSRMTNRDEKLTAFIEKVQESQTGIVFKNFNNVLELKKELKKGLSQLLSKRFTSLEDLRKENEELKNEISAKKLTGKDQLRDSSVIQVLPPKNLGVTPSSEYGRVLIRNFEIPKNIFRGKKFTVSVSINGTTSNGFLDLVLISPNNLHFWLPDPISWNSINDNGTLELKNNSYSALWECEIPPKWETGIYRAVMGVYENNFANRRLIHYVEKEVIVE